MNCKRIQHNFSAEVLEGPNSEVTATLRISYARFFTSQRFRDLAATWHLTPRETQVAVLHVKGMVLEEIAEALGISHNTVATHVVNLHRKLGVTSAGRAVLKLILASGVLLTEDDWENLRLDPRECHEGQRTYEE